MNNSDNKVDFNPVISSIQKVALYETKSVNIYVSSTMRSDEKQLLQFVFGCCCRNCCWWEAMIVKLDSGCWRSTERIHMS